MGYFGKIKDKMKAQDLRRQGLAYSEILLQVSVSKGTLSLWCKDIMLTEEQKRKLMQNKMFGQRKGSLVAADNKRQARILRTEQIRNAAMKELGFLKERDKMIAGIALYAGEGDKTDGKGGFSNADPNLIKFMSEWFQNYAKIPLSKMRGAVYLHEGLSEKTAKIFWSELTGIPLSQFRKTYIAKIRNENKKYRKNIHQYGVFSIRFTDAAIHRKIMGWIYAVFGDKMITLSPVAQW